MQTRVTYCRICEAGCGLLADMEGEEVVALRPDPDHVVSRGYACAKGTRFLEVHKSPERIDRPLIRRNGRLVPTSWEEAIADAGARIRRIRDAHGPHSIGVYIGNPAAFSYTIPTFGMAFVKGLGTRNYYGAGSLDCNNKFVVSARMLGSPATHPVPDLDNARFALLLGTNPLVSQSSFVHAPRMVERLQKIEKSGGRVFVVDPRRTETARSVGTWVPIVPNTDAALLLALLHVVFAEKLEHGESVRRHSNGIDELRRAVRGFTPERVATITRVPAETIVTLARGMAQSDGAFCHVSTGVNQGTFGNIAYAAKIALELVTGNLDRTGGALVPKGALDTARLAHTLGFDKEPEWRSRVGGFRSVMGTMPTGILADEILTDGPERIRALVVMAGNPVLSGPDGARMRAALDRLDAFVSIDLFVNDTATTATHVLPCTDFLEREDFPLATLQLQPEPYLQWTDAVVAPRGERRPEWRILCDLAKSIGIPLHGSRLADAATRALVGVGGARALAAPLLASALGPRPFKKLGQSPHGIRVDREKDGDFLERRIRTRSKKVELYPEDVWERLPELEKTLTAVQRDPAELSLKLFTKREKNGHNSWMHGNRRLSTDEHAVYVSPADAERLGVTEGDRVRIATDVASIELPVVISRDVVEGAVCVPHGYGHDPESSWTTAAKRGGANVNLLASAGADSVDRLSGMTQYVGLSVQLTRVASTAASAAE
jgi:anaerobic selenocysteine-containing dehydrogenase